jgi:hypothetical protein
VKTLLNEVNPPIEEVLQHFGTKGMKWGVRRDSKFAEKAARIAKSGSPRQQRNIQIKVARKNVRTRENEIIALDRASRKAKDPVQRQKLDALATKKAVELFNHPDNLTASRMTSGEKWVNGILITGAIGIAGAAAAAKTL